MSASVNTLNWLICNGDKEGVIRQMESHKMTPEFFHDLRIKNGQSDMTYFPVTMAATWGQLEVMNAIIDRGFDPDDRTSGQKWCPITWACSNGHLHVVKYLVEVHNVDLDSINEDFDSGIFMAIIYEHSVIVKYLIESGATVDSLVFHECVRFCRPEMVEYILSKGTVDVNSRCNQTTPLLNLPGSLYPYSNALVLLNAGANIEDKDEDGNTTFLLAAHWQEVELMRLLVSRGADRNAVNNNGDIALHCTLISNPKDMDINLRNDKFYCATEYLVVEIGLECLNTRNSQGLTPIAAAIKSFRCKRILEVLVNYGCNITDEFELLDDDRIELFEVDLPNYKEFFQHLKQLATPPRSLKNLAVAKIRRQLGVSLQSAMTELPLPKILKDFIRIQTVWELTPYSLYLFP